MEKQTLSPETSDQVKHYQSISNNVELVPLGEKVDMSRDGGGGYHTIPTGSGTESDSASDCLPGPDIQLSVQSQWSNRRNETKWYQSLGDFFNCLKAFIGTNYQALPFAFHNSGLALGVLGVAVIATLTDHCIQLLIKSKNAVIDRICREQIASGEIHPGEQHHLWRRLEVTVGYGDVGKAVLGPGCFHLIQFAVWFTQFFTVMSYYIFIGNTVYEIFPVVPVPYIINNSTIINGTVMLTEPDRHGHGVPMLHITNINKDKFPGQPAQTQHLREEDNLTNHTDSDDLTRNKRDISLGNSTGTQNGTFSDPLGNLTSILSTTSSHTTPDGAVHYTSPVLVQNNSVLADNNLNNSEPISSLTSTSSVLSNEISSTVSGLSNVSPLPNTPTSHPTTITDGGDQELLTTPEDIISTLTVTESVTLSPTTTKEEVTNITNATTSPEPPAPTDIPAYFQRSTAPPLLLVILFPLPFFLGTSLIRKVRYLAPFSSISTLALAIGIFSVLGFIITNFKVSEFEWFKFKSLPLFLGQLIGAYEGIGVIVPIQSSMEGNHHMFPWFLHSSVTIVFFVLCSFGVLGYLSYGEAVEQIIVLNIPQHSFLAIAVDITLIISVLFTYPLQCFPVIEILESYLFAPGRCGPDPGQLGRSHGASGEEERGLLGDESGVEASAEHVSVVIPQSVATWKRNLLRIILTLVTVGIAVLLKDAYAYTAAFTGAIGASLLAFILPCMIHLRAEWENLPWYMVVKDVAIIAFAGVSSILALVEIGWAMVRGTSSGL